MIFKTAGLVCLKISYAANEIYCLTVKTNGDAAAGQDRIFLDNEEPSCLRRRGTDSSRERNQHQ